MTDYMPTTGEVRDSLVYLNKYHARQRADVDVDLLVFGSETAAQFDRWLAEVRRQAAEEAWDEGHDAGWNSRDDDAARGWMPSGVHESDAENPYRKEVAGDE